MLDAVTGWTLFAGLVLSTGAVAARWLIIPRTLGVAAPLREAWARRAAEVGVAGSILAAAGVTLYFGRQLAEFRDPFVPWTEDAALLLSTAWGNTWKGAAVASLGAVGAFLAARSDKLTGWWIATPLVLVLGSFPGLTGHAAGVAEARGLMLFADAVHVWAAGAWIGGLTVVLFAARSRPSDADEGSVDPLVALVPAFSPVAIAAVALLVTTGALASWTHLSDLGALATTRYGRTLSLKLILVGATLALGARNFRILTPRLGTADGDRDLRRSAAVELALAQAVLLATALLVRTSPGEH